MAPSRRPRNPSKRFAKVNEEAFCKDGKNSNKNRVRKRNLSDKLGSQWTTEELEQFYDSYRKYGKDWKKVTSALRNRTCDMVEALYSMNTAYLSLPEGKATAAGLIAMMCDHYDMLEGSDSDRESNDIPQTSHKPQKRSQGKFRLISKGVNETSAHQFQNKSTTANYGCLSLLKRKRSGDVLAVRGPRAVGKRTPRIAVSSMSLKDERPTFFSPIKHVPQAEAVSAEDDDLHAALALAEASHRGGSPQVSRTPSRRIDYMKSSPTRSTGKKNGKLEIINSVSIDAHLDDDFPEGSLESREADDDNYTRCINRALDNRSSSATEVEGRMGIVHRKPLRMKGYENDHFDDEKEACSGTEGGPSMKKSKDEMYDEVSDRKTLLSSKFLRKTSRQLYFGDESSGLDALQTLADLSLNILMPPSTVESESSVLVKEDRKSVDEKLSITESFPTNEKKDRPRISRKREKSSTCCGGADAVKSSSNSKPVKSKHHETNISDMKLQAGFSGSKTVKRKPKSLSQKISTSDPGNDFDEASQKKEVATDEGKETVTKAKRASQVTPPPKHGKLVKSSEYSSSSIDIGRTFAESAETTINVRRMKQTNLPNGGSSRRKINLKKSQDIWDIKSNEIAVDEYPAKYSHLNHEMKKLSHCLSSRLLRRWCTFEWFYSAIDYPWFAQSEFVCYLNHVHLGHIPTLTRVEWSVIRSSLGKPRRLSKQFLQEEREKLEQYRESVQAHYADLRAGIREGLPTDLARPLTVGQRVISCYPKTRDIHDGSILTVDRSRCRVQFDRPELGVEFVMDIDCMPLNPSENMPEALQRLEVANKYLSTFSDAKFDDQSEWKSGTSMKHSLIECSDILERSSQNIMNTLLKHAKGDTIDAIVQAKATANEVAAAAQQSMHSQPCTLAQLQAREADIQALAELTRSLDKKQALLKELRHMNEEVSEKQNEIKDSEHFRKQYAMVLFQLRDANDQVRTALRYLRQRNTYHGNSRPPWFSSEECSDGPAVGSATLSTTAFLGLNSGSHIAEIVENSRRSARIMVGAAIEEICCLREGEDAFARVTDALTCANNTQGPSHFTDSVNGSSFHQDLTTSSTSEQALPSCNSVIYTSSKSSDTQFPLELISSCVASLLMIQNCTERQYPPAEVAQILDIAVTNLLPCTQQNISLYREIETCMGIIKNQMLALIPIPNSIHPDTSIM